MASNWSLGSWRSHQARQQPSYPDEALLDATLSELSAYPPLVSLADATALKQQLALAASGEAFLLQGGDCAESFAEFSPDAIRRTAELLSHMAARIGAASGLAVIILGRMAGQFAKPRTHDLEQRGELALPPWRGDIVNGIALDPVARRPQPERMFRAYAQSAAALAQIRGIAAQLGAPVYASHEALLLPYEEALVRNEKGRWHASSAHFLWIGQRTFFPGSAHVELARGLANPIGAKCGPDLRPEILLRLLDILNPEREPGRVTLISRMGDKLISEALPPLLRAVRSEGHRVVWACDPMHGNTEKRADGRKLRRMDRIASELRTFLALAEAERVVPGGVHLEMTGEDVVECTEGRQAGIAPEPQRYHSYCDPRLNPRQAMEIAELLSALIRGTASAAGAKAA